MEKPETNNGSETLDHDKASLKIKVARSLKWNVIDKLLTQVLYAVTGVILARIVSEQDFGLVGAVLIFQSFATLFIDSGFAQALLQRKDPTRLDYSTVFWFNLGMATLLYVALYIAAPWIAGLFQNDERFVPLARVMFLTFILNATALVQISHLTKIMDVRMIAVSNSVGLVAAAVVGIWLALAGWGAWAIVWQTITLAAVKSGVLWLTSGWRPLVRFSWGVLRSFFRVGSGVMATSFLNVTFQNIYGFFIGNRVGMVSLGYYYQADKWSKMGVASIAAILTSSFLPALSQYQNDPQRFAALTSKMNRCAAYVCLPSMIFLAVMSTPLFHALFSTKWDPSVALFQILLVRGIFTIFTTLYHNFILALGRSRLMFYTELIRDGAAVVAIAVTLPFISLSSAADITEGVRIFLWGQLIASAATYVVSLVLAARIGWRSWVGYITDVLPYLGETIVAAFVMWVLSIFIVNPWLLMLCQAIAGIGVYVGLNALMSSRIQRDALVYLKILPGKSDLLD